MWHYRCLNKSQILTKNLTLIESFSSYNNKSIHSKGDCGCRLNGALWYLVIDSSHLYTKKGASAVKVPVLCAWLLSLCKYSYTTFLLLSCLRWFKAFSFSTFPIYHETHTSALQLATKSYQKDWWHLPICSYIIEGQKS